MTFLLTSAGLTTPKLQEIFLQLTDQFVGDPAQAQVAYISTASHPEKDTSYVQENIDALQRLGVKKVINVDISVGQAWKKELKQSDVLYVGGGNTFYLLHKMKISGFAKLLPELLKTKFYVGTSAGSIVVTPDISIASVEPADPNVVNITDMTGIGLVPFEISPHTPDLVPLATVEKYAATAKHPVYAYDDTSAVLVKDGHVSFVGEEFQKVLE